MSHNNLVGKLRYNLYGKAKTKQPKKSDVLILAIIRKGALLTVKLLKSLGQMKKGSFEEYVSFDVLMSERLVRRG